MIGNAVFCICSTTILERKLRKTRFKARNNIIRLSFVRMHLARVKRFWSVESETRALSKSLNSPVRGRSRLASNSHVLSSTLMRFHRFSCALKEFELMFSLHMRSQRVWTLVHSRSSLAGASHRNTKFSVNFPITLHKCETVSSTWTIS